MSKKSLQILPAKTGYNEIAKQYKAMHNYLDEFEQDKLIPLLGDIAGLEVLDVGAGSGRLLNRLLKKGAKITALDSSKCMLKLIRPQIKDQLKEIKIGQAESLPFIDQSFDIVLAVFLIVHLKDPSVFLREAWRVLRPAGHLLITNVNQKKPVAVDIAQGRVAVESFYHRPSDISDQVVQAGFDIEKDFLIKEKEIWINQIILAKK
ncbi:MAG: hypothetical protein COU31_03770 [Candidatus Magasanikbacteria bacterium CG10_big_fil_rev_8_21_14_0_10_40_10]|uniref:Methyltransferase type 11 domain-containing protein n=1 Tax=Candidatus Magasanikbacteria bacterium CG10_big_fil_rev_8_21_14_0_10_40_10 TaxID=1974648 RepID=A0A2M6W3A5_9BACT|nr:MAG: hypothetical protein COU31_03770 [Candidatus Magasanikbacteria bacterium CG10_big_fil_rev_8_21_14_0_10_40_10]